MRCATSVSGRSCSGEVAALATGHRLRGRRTLPRLDQRFAGVGQVGRI
jgi:hypothetical protein